MAEKDINTLIEEIAEKTGKTEAEVRELIKGKTEKFSGLRPRLRSISRKFRPQGFQLAVDQKGSGHCLPERFGTILRFTGQDLQRGAADQIPQR